VKKLSRFTNKNIFSSFQNAPTFLIRRKIFRKKNPDNIDPWGIFYASVLARFEDFGCFSRYWCTTDQVVRVFHLEIIITNKDKVIQVFFSYNKPFYFH